eukprot:426448-Amorphochlora_amoeboformis.AAC.1
MIPIRVRSGKGAARCRGWRREGLLIPSEVALAWEWVLRRRVRRPNEIIDVRQILHPFCTSWRTQVCARRNALLRHTGTHRNVRLSHAATHRDVPFSHGHAACRDVSLRLGRDITFCSLVVTYHGVRISLLCGCCRGGVLVLILDRGSIGLVFVVANRDVGRDVGRDVTPGHARRSRDACWLPGFRGIATGDRNGDGVLGLAIGRRWSGFRGRFRSGNGRILGCDRCCRDRNGLATGVNADALVRGCGGGGVRGEDEGGRRGKGTRGV